MTAQPIGYPVGYEVIFDENGTPQFSTDSAARLRSRLGHDPAPGERLTLVESVEDVELDPKYRDDFENWLRTEGVAAYDRAKAHPELMIPAAQMRAELASWYAEQTATAQ
jgi:hypothetical protein